MNYKRRDWAKLCWISQNFPKIYLKRIFGTKLFEKFVWKICWVYVLFDCCDMMAGGATTLDMFPSNAFSNDENAIRYLTNLGLKLN